MEVAWCSFGSGTQGYRSVLQLPDSRTRSRNVAQTLRSTFPVNLDVTKEFVHVMSEVDSGETDALITNFETLSSTTDESCPVDEEEAVRTLVTWKSLDRT